MTAMVATPPPPLPSLPWNRSGRSRFLRSSLVSKTFEGVGVRCHEFGARRGGMSELARGEENTWFEPTAERRAASKLGFDIQGMNA